MDKTPQLENGFMRLATELTCQLQKTHLSGNEWQVLWVVFCKTYGWNKKEDFISLTQFQNETGLRRNKVTEALQKLVLKKVLLINKDTYINSYKFNKNYTEWHIDKLVPKTVPSSEKGTRVVPKRVLKLVPKREHTIDKKDTYTKDISPLYISPKGKKKFSSLKDINQEVLLDIAKKYNVPIGLVELNFEKMKAWLESNGKVKKDYRATLRGFVLRDISQVGIKRLENRKEVVDATGIESL